MVSEKEKKDILKCALENSDDFLINYYKNHPNKKYAEHYLITNFISHSEDYSEEEYDQLCEEEENLFGYTEEEWEYELETLGKLNKQYASECKRALNKLKI